MGMGEEVYARFGHAAVRVRSPLGRDLVYNYGYTNFKSRSLVLSFLRGQTRFWLSVGKYNSTLKSYRREDRSIFVQTFNLSPSQQNQIARFLKWNAQPAHRYYTYHHFKDNCSTRIRDLLNDLTQGKLRQQLQGKPMGYTYRELARQGFAGRIELLFLLDLLLGRSVDHPIDLWEGAFLPHVLRDTLAQVKLADNKTFATKPFPRYLQMRLPLPRDCRAGIKLLWVIAGFTTLLGTLLVVFIRRFSRWSGVPLLLFSLFLGLCAVLIWSVSILSTLPELRWNELLLILWPTDLLLLVPAWKWMRGRISAGRLLSLYIHIRTGVFMLVCLGHLFGILYQQPRVWLLIVGIANISLLTAVRIFKNSKLLLLG